MNPETIDTLVIMTTPTNNDDQSDEYPCTFTQEDDPLADPLSLNAEDTSDDTLNDEIIIPKESEKTEKSNICKKDQTIRLVNVQELAKIVTVVEPKPLKIVEKSVNELKPSKTIGKIINEPKPSCSGISSTLKMPNFELDDLEDLIQSSRIANHHTPNQTKINKIEQEPVPSTSHVHEILENLSCGDDKSQSSLDDDQYWEKQENEVQKRHNEGETKTNQGFSEDSQSNSMFFLEDFEDQITQNVLNKTDINNSLKIDNEEDDQEQAQSTETTEQNTTPADNEPVITVDDKETDPVVEALAENPEIKKLFGETVEPTDIKPNEEVTLSEICETNGVDDSLTKETPNEVSVIEMAPIEVISTESTPTEIISTEITPTDVILEEIQEIEDKQELEKDLIVPETVFNVDLGPVASSIDDQTLPNELKMHEIELTVASEVISNQNLDVITHEMPPQSICHSVEDSLSVIVEAVDIIQSQAAAAAASSSNTTGTTVLNKGRDEEDGGLRSDGSDSGLGSEPSHNSSGLSDKSVSQTVTTRLPDPPAKGNLKRRSSEQIDDCSAIGTKRKKGIQFAGVTVYSFPRQQGFSCVPSQGGCTLGMANQHVAVKQYSLSEHSAEQKRNHKPQLADMNAKSSSSDDSDSEYEPSDSSSEADSEVYGFLQPISAKQRKALLKATGVRKIDTTEKDECKMIRTSREVCGCTCRVYCDPDTCACSLSGIKCQVDRPNFPCGCTRGGCGNVVGRVEFSPVRVRTHYIHTVMRLQMQNKQDRLRSSTNAASTASSNNYKAWQVQQQQQQSNIRQVPSNNSVNSGNSCVDGRSLMTPEATTQPAQSHCDLGLMYENHSLSSNIVIDTVPVPSTSSSASYSYQSETSYPNHIIEYVPKPSTSYANNASSYDPNISYMTSPYPDTQSQQPQQQYMEIPYETMEAPTYQIHSYDHHSYAMQPHQMNFIPYNQYNTTTNTPIPSHTPYMYHNGYLPNQLICEPQMYQTPSTQQPVVITQQHNSNSSYNNVTITAAVPSSNNNCHNNIPPATKILHQETNQNNCAPTNNSTTNPSLVLPLTSTQQMVPNSNGNANENLCEIIKKGIVETVSG